MAFNNGNYSTLVDGSQGNNTNTDNTGNDPNATNTQEEEPIENKWNDLTGMFKTADEGMRMNDDTPSVEIYISREKVWTKNDEGEYDWDSDTSKMAKELAEAYMNDSEVNDKNTTIIKMNDQQVAASNAINNITQADLNNATRNQNTNSTSTRNTR